MAQQNSVVSITCVLGCGYNLHEVCARSNASKMKMVPPAQSLTPDTKENINLSVFFRVGSIVFYATFVVPVRGILVAKVQHRASPTILKLKPVEGCLKSCKTGDVILRVAGTRLKCLRGLGLVHEKTTETLFLSLVFE